MHIGTRIDAQAVSTNLLGSHVAQGPDQLASFRQVAVLIEGAGDSEIDDLRVAVRIDEHVLRLEITVHDATLVRVLHGGANLQQDLKLLPLRPRPLRGPVRKGLRPLDELHCKERPLHHAE